MTYNVRITNILCNAVRLVPQIAKTHRDPSFVKPLVCRDVLVIMVLSGTL
eukprot:TRINITY_DN4785_c0_g1_i3.p5 TRINITY_DN4785_c0_g1~~TRINITY_DN4785_c0_g1_i3.p5  ORF type:complete len:50 (-),score=3.69 TRINITY_DN4785_c0_g1_i3:23-172(-)